MPFTERIQAASGVAGAKEDKEAKDDVLIVGTGRAIEKVVEIAAWLQRKGDLRVSLRTSSVGTVDDLVPVESGERDDGDAGGNDGQENEDEAASQLGKGELGRDAIASEPSARVRWMSCLEVGVRMK
jgi:ribonuclease P/MRP protein subunit POP7